MSLEEKVMAKMKDAMRAKDEAALRSLRAIKAEILKAKTEPGSSGTITEMEEVKLVQKLIKQRKDSLEIFEKQSREDLAAKEREEIAVIENFLPEQLTAEELKAAIKQIVEETGAAGPAAMGKMMGVASKQLAGKADGKAIASMVKEVLA